ncbi:hypothetical protein FACS18948_4160 [Clostridia bacterium]|nr:hypothetical protein FACS18948_4160 [Clostridia bacterium]
MELMIFDHDRKLAGIVESFSFLRWSRRYSRCGSFELKAIASSENLALLQIGNYLWKSDDGEAGIIENLTMSQTDKEMITVSGRFATSILARRIMWGTVTLNHDLNVVIQFLINNSIMAPATEVRRIDYITYAGVTTGHIVKAQISYRNILDCATQLCEAADVGLKTMFNTSTGIFTVTLYKGTTSQAVFSREYENITEQVFTKNISDYANTALIGGAGEGADRLFMSIADGIGEDRREVFVDARDMQQATYGTNYNASLLFRGQTKLSELAVVQSFDATVSSHGNLLYKQDFDLGQVVQVISKRWGVALTTRITEIEETYDETGLNLNVVFGRGLLTLAQKLKGSA